MTKKAVDVFLQIVKIGIGTSTRASMLEHIDWNAIEALAEQQGLLAIMVDGVEQLPEEDQGIQPSLAAVHGQGQDR